MVNILTFINFKGLLEFEMEDTLEVDTLPHYIYVGF